MSISSLSGSPEDITFRQLMDQASSRYERLCMEKELLVQELQAATGTIPDMKVLSQRHASMVSVAAPPALRVRQSEVEPARTGLVRQVSPQSCLRQAEYHSTISFKEDVFSNDFAEPSDARQPLRKDESFDGLISPRMLARKETQSLEQGQGDPHSRALTTYGWIDDADNFRAFTPMSSVEDGEEPECWPSLIQAREDFQVDEDDQPLSKKWKNKDMNCASYLRKSMLQKYATVDKSRPPPLLGAGFVLHPESIGMMIFDLSGVIVVFMEVFITPLVVAWELALDGPLEGLSWFLACYWLLDFTICLNTGFYRAGYMKMKRRDIFFNYLEGWLIPDFFLLAIDFLSLVLQQLGENAGVVQTLRVCRLLKVLRISRLIRFVQKAMAWSLLLSVRFAVQIVPVVFIALLMLHLLACIWFVIGTKGPTDTSRRWIDIFEDDIEQTSFSYQYFTALHWTVAQMTLGATDVTSVTSLERLYNVILLIIALLSGSTLISVVSAEVVQLVMLKEDKMVKLSNLRRFLLQESVPAKLSARVQRQAMDRLEQQSPIMEESVSSVDTLSRSLRLELLYATRIPIIVQHPLFRTWASIDMNAVECLCQKAVSFKFLRVEDDLFLQGEYAVAAFEVAEGLMDYVQHDQQQRSELQDKQGESCLVEVGAWVCEAALWCHWTHVGRLTAVWPCKVMLINTEGLVEVFHMVHSIRSVTLTYAKNYHQRVVQAVPPHAQWPTDVRVPNTDASDLLSRDVDIELLKIAVQHGSVDLNPDEQANLEVELSQGRCCLQSTSGGGLFRVVALVALKLMRGNGDIFVQVGKTNAKGDPVVSCQLPGTKRRRGELPISAVRRLIRDDLTPLQDGASLDAFEHAVERMTSPKYGVDTMYLKAVQLANFEDEVEDVTAVVCDGNLSPEAVEVLDGIYPRDIYMIPDHQGRHQFYTWLPEDCLNYLKSPETKPALQAWLDTLALQDSSDSEFLGHGVVFRTRV